MEIVWAAIVTGVFGLLAIAFTRMKNENKRDHDANHHILVKLETAVGSLQTDFTYHLADHITQAQRQTQAALETLKAAELLRTETERAAQTLAKATTAAAELLAAQTPNQVALTGAVTITQ